MKSLTPYFLDLFIGEGCFHVHIIFIYILLIKKLYEKFQNEYHNKWIIVCYHRFYKTSLADMEKIPTEAL